MTKHAKGTSKKLPLVAGAWEAATGGQLCLQAHYAAIVEAHKDVEIYQLGDVDCPSCLRLMAEKHEAIAEMFRARLAALTGPARCRVYDTACINPSYCAARDACCAGDPDCQPDAKEAP